MRWGPALLFCPGDRADRFHKAAAAADSVIIDLEDAVDPGSKELARQELRRTPLGSQRTIVRVNSRSSGELEADLDALAHTDYQTVMLPKTESLADLEAVSRFEVIALCETPAGIREAALIARQGNVVALAWGAEDLIASLGGSSSRKASGVYRDVVRYARSQVLIAAASEGKPAYDAVHLGIEDVEGLRQEADDASSSGFAGVMCIHPSQVSTIRDAFRPSTEIVAWATALLDEASHAEQGVFLFNGRMVDEPVLRQAREIVRRAGSRPRRTKN